jgi:DNA-binding NarL/FixJ family response regulator
LVDLKLPGMGGVECISRLKPLLPDVLCLVITQFDDSDLLFDALQAGADGYLLKRASDKEIIEAIHTVAEGGGAMSASICRKVLEHFQKLAPSADAQSTLSDREMEALQLARRGKRAKEIARTMNLSYETVRTHFRNIYRKLHVHSLRAAVEKTFRR